MRRTTNLILIGALLVFGSCTIKQQTRVPDPIRSTQASADGNRFDSGDISYDADGAIKSEHWIQRYDAMLAVYGKRFTPPVEPGDRKGILAAPPHFRVTAQVSSRFTRMNQWRKAEAGRP